MLIGYGRRSSHASANVNASNLFLNRYDEEEYSNVKAAGFGSNSSLELLTTFLSVNGFDDGLDGLDGVTTKGSSSSDPPTLCSSDCCW